MKKLKLVWCVFIAKTKEQRDSLMDKVLGIIWRIGRTHQWGRKTVTKNTRNFMISPNCSKKNWLNRNSLKKEGDSPVVLTIILCRWAMMRAAGRVTMTGWSKKKRKLPKRNKWRKKCRKEAKLWNTCFTSQHSHKMESYCSRAENCKLSH